MDPGLIQLKPSGMFQLKASGMFQLKPSGVFQLKPSSMIQLKVSGMIQLKASIPDAYAKRKTRSLPGGTACAAGRRFSRLRFRSADPHCP
jgi:hypothetical protein